MARMAKGLALVLLANSVLLGACSYQLRPDSLAPEQSEPSSLESKPHVAERTRREFQQAVTAVKQQHWPSAIERFEKLASEYPKLSGPALNLALIYQQQAQPNMAEPWFQRAITANPANQLAYNQYAIFLRHQGRFDAAKQQYLLALAVSENDANTHRNLAVLYDLYLGEPALALQHFQRSRELQSSDVPELAIWLADVEHQLTAQHQN